MARYFKKRRKNQGPNKNEEKVQRAADARHRENSGGTLGEAFASVNSLKLHVRFLTAQGHILDEKVLSLGPNDPCRFEEACPGRCGTGQFDFSDAIAQAVNARQALCESSVPCSEPAYPGSRESCGCQAQCRIELAYLPLPERVPSAGPGPSALP